MGWRGIRRDIINAGKRAMTASGKEAERNERVRQKALRAAPPQAHYSSAPHGYRPPLGQAYGPAPQGYAPQGDGAPPAPSWAAPSQKSGLTAGLLVAMIFGSLFFCGTCSVIMVGAANTISREASPTVPVRAAVVVPAPSPTPTVQTPTQARAAAAAPRSVVPTTPARRAPAAAPTPAPPSGPRCCDGSPARCTGRGCCSHHGGVCG